MSLLEQIDDLRGAFVAERARRDEARLADRWMTATDAAMRMWELETRINQLLREYIALPDCPHKGCPGKMEETPTKHVRMCTKCKAVLLPGRMVPFLHVEIT